MRTLVETGVLVGERGAYRLAQPLDTLQVPATVRAAGGAHRSAATGGQTPAPDRRRHWYRGALAAASGHCRHADEALYRSLAQLQAAEFYETSLFPERAYTFKHALTHEVAMGVYSRSDGARCTRASSRRWRPWRGSGGRPGGTAGAACPTG